ncbi:MAG: hypothetical protein CMN56_14960 [Sneathiella sp.]|nr:hypothetical protein [Sneathiella sp.]
MASSSRVSFSSAPNAAIGISAALIIVIIWSGWLVASRAGVQSELTVYDIMAFRFGISGLLALPYVLYAKPWRHMTIRNMALAAVVTGVPYCLVLFAAFNYAPAAHGAVFMNGILPTLVMIFGYFLFKEKPNRQQIIGAILIITGASCAAFGVSGFDIGSTWLGDLMFVAAATFFVLYLMMNRAWRLSVSQIWFCGSILNALVFVPVWWLFLPTGIPEVPTDQLLLQMGYQGILPNMVGLVLVSIAVRNVGPSVTAAIMSGVPASGALLGYIFLGEELTWLGIMSLLILTPGIIIASLPSRAKP